MSDNADPRDLFGTGYKRDHVETARYDCIPFEVLRRLAMVYAEGSRKYGDRNWRKGCPWSDVYNHAVEHIRRWITGDTTEDNLAKAMWGLATLMYFEAHGLGADNLTDKPARGTGDPLREDETNEAFKDPIVISVRGSQWHRLALMHYLREDCGLEVDALDDAGLVVRLSKEKG